MECKIIVFLRHFFLYLKISSVLIILFISRFGFANTSLDCPQRIEVNQEMLSSYNDWRVIASKGNHRFRRMTFKVKADPGELRSDSEEHKNNTTKIHWNFPLNEEIEQVCEYSGTLVKLVKKIDAKSCDVLIRSNNSDFISVECRK